MEPTLVLQTKTFALGLYSLLRHMDPARWGGTRKQALRDKIAQLEAEVHRLYDHMQGISSDLALESLDQQPTAYTMATLRKTLGKVGVLLTELKAMPIDNHLSYIALYNQGKRLQKAYQKLSLIMEACQAPIPQIRPSNLARSLFHCASALAVLGMIAAVPSFSWMFWIALAYFAFCWSTEGLKRISPEMKSKVMKLFAPIAHPHEYDKINSATWYGVALLLLSLMNEPVGIIAVAVLGFADPAAALVGRKFGKIPMPGNRSLEGSLTFFAVGTLAATLALSIMHPLPQLWQTVLVCAVASLAGAVGEYAGKYPDDNLTIPLAAAGGAFAVIGFL